MNYLKYLPDGLTNEQLRLLVKSIKTKEYELNDYGDRGIIAIGSTVDYCLYEMTERPNGAQQLVELLDDPELSWDAGHALILSDAIVKCKYRAIEHLKMVENEKDMAIRCIKLIETGVGTAI